MKRKTRSDEMRSDYDFDYSKAVRGKYYKRIVREGSNIVMLEPDIAKAFPTSAVVNEVLRAVLQAAQATRRITNRSTRSRAKASRSG